MPAALHKISSNMGSDPCKRPHESSRKVSRSYCGLGGDFSVFGGNMLRDSHTNPSTQRDTKELVCGNQNNVDLFFPKQECLLYFKL